MNCFIRRIATAEEEAAVCKVAASRSEMGTDMIGNGEGYLQSLQNCRLNI